MAIVLIWSRYISRLLLVTPISFKRSHFSTFNPNKTVECRSFTNWCRPPKAQRQQANEWQRRVFIIIVASVIASSVPVSLSMPMLPFVLTSAWHYLCRGVQLMNEQNRPTVDSRRRCHNVHHPVCLFTALWGRLPACLSGHHHAALFVVRVTIQLPVVTVTTAAALVDVALCY